MKSKSLKNIELEYLKLILNKMTVVELKEVAKLENLPLKGKKSEIVDRIYTKFLDTKAKYIEELTELNIKHKFTNEISGLYWDIEINQERNSRIIYEILKDSNNVKDVNDIFNLDTTIIHGNEDTYDTFVNYLEKNDLQRNKFFLRFFNSQTKVETLESKYLELYYYFFLFYKDDILKGLKTKYDIIDDWDEYWDPSGEISNFSTGAERVIYALINGRGIGNPNSAPVGSDLFFELDDAYIHMDLKTVSTDNIGDYISDIFVGNNQNSYNGNITIDKVKKIYDNANLPTRYSKGKGKEKITLTYFITILYDKESLEVLNINLLSMPNGELYDIYGEDILKAGKNQYDNDSDKKKTHAETIRYKWSEAVLFETLINRRRIKVVYMNENMDEKYKEKLILMNKVYNMQYHN